MEISRRNVAFGALFCGAATLGASEMLFAEATHDEDVDRAVDAFRVAMVGADGDALRKLCCDQLSFGHSNGLVQSKGEFIQSVVSEQEIFRTITLLDRQNVRSGNVAVERHLFRADITLAGRDISVELGVVEVWQKNERWQLLARQAFKV